MTATRERILKVETVEPHRFLYEHSFGTGKPARWRYKVLYGGRMGLKSWSAVHALLVLGMQRPLRIICGRETQASIRESVHQLLESRIRALDLTDYYEILQYTIRSRHANSAGERTEFLFHGLRDEDVRNLKSLEAADILWVEEAACVSKHSWETIIPTVRKPSSEIWVTFNPLLATDDTYDRFIINTRPDAKVVKTTYLENPWITPEMLNEANVLKARNPGMYRHVWLGECITEIDGAIFGEQLKQLEAEGRLCDLPIDRTRPIDTAWDLGFGDATAIWFVQSINGWYHLIDYEEGFGKTIDHYQRALQGRGYNYGVHWLPHDSVDAIVHNKLANANKQRSIEQILRAGGLTVRIAPKLHVADRINAGRTVFAQVKIDQNRCRQGLQRLRHYQWQPPSQVRLESGGTSPVPKREPLHNEHSHGADAYQTLAVMVRVPEAPPPPPQESRGSMIRGIWQ